MKSLKNIHIPTLIALLILIAGIGSGLFLIHQKQNSRVSASVDILPQNLKTSNQTAFKGSKAEVTFTWQTTKPTTGFILYGFSPDSLSFVNSDTRDKNKASENQYLNHYITLSNLPAKKTIYYTVGINNVGVGQCQDTKTFCTSSAQCPKSKCAPMSFTTPPSLANKSAFLAQGQVLDENKQPLAGALVFINTTGSNLLSSLTDESGQWSINLALLRQADLSTYLNLDKQASQVSLTAIYGQKKSQGSCLTINLDPAPSIILNQAYNCQKANNNNSQILANPNQSLSPTPINQRATPTPSQKESGFQMASPSGQPLLELINPSYEGQKIATSSPVIKGKGPSNKKIEVTIHSKQEITTDVYVDENGQWHWKPPLNLEPGRHTITLKYVDDNGQQHTLTRHFFVTASGQALDQTPAYTASASAQNQTTLITPTPTPTFTPTPTPIQHTSSMPATTSGVPKTGASDWFNLVVISAFMLTIGCGLFYSVNKNNYG